jgi:hypothetical protein
MIGQGHISAKLDQKQKMISFTDSNDNTSDQTHSQDYLSVVEELERQNKRIVQLMAQVQ